jgi:hypothetical protein
MLIIIFYNLILILNIGLKMKELDAYKQQNLQIVRTKDNSFISNRSIDLSHLEITTTREVKIIEKINLDIKIIESNETQTKMESDEIHSFV